jgi:hypothetical protein
VTATLGAAELRRALRTALDGLQAHRTQIDDANVYPVPDGDTGTNLVMTMESVVRALDGVPDRPAEVARAVTQSSLTGARGNSGVILAQFLRGLCEGIGAGPEEAGIALKRAAELSYQAMTKPREGTMLTVARAAAEAAQGVRTLPELFEAAAAAALDALAHTPDLLPALRANDVVDAGGIGLCIVIDAIAATVSGREAEPVAVELRGARAVRPRESGSLEFAYEVQYLLDAPDQSAPVIRERLEAIGDSVAVVGGEGLWNVHVHTNDVGHAIEIGVEHGRPHSIGVVAFEDQIAETRGLPLAVAPSPVAALVLADGDGLAAAYQELGAAVAAADATSDEIATRVDTLSAPDVVLVACSQQARTNAQTAAARTRRTVEILDAPNGAAAFAAMIAFNESSDFVDNLSEMRAAIAGARSGTAHAEDEVIAAVRDEPGEVLTVFTGAGVGDDQRKSIASKLRDAFPNLTVDVRDGGQRGERFAFVVE